MRAGARCWAVVPAAGVGKRMGRSTPKQYLPLLGRPVIEHSLRCMIGHPRVDAVYVALGAADGWWAGTAYADHRRVNRVAGGEERCDSVLNALNALEATAAADDWVLVHDAARPCVRTGDLDRLFEALDSHPVGGLLGIAASDTMKRVGADDRVAGTVDRDGLWHAFTPQMFRYGRLREALVQARERGLVVTDDSSAIELNGETPLMIEGHPDNIKITRPDDLDLAAFYLSRRQD